MCWGCEQVEFNNQTLDKRCMSTVQLLIDIEMLAHSDYMTGTLNSGIPYLIEVSLIEWLAFNINTSRKP